MTDATIAAAPQHRPEDDALLGAVFTQRVLDSSPDCIKLLDLDGRIEYVSPGGCRAMELDCAGSLLGLSWIDLWPAEHGPKLRAAFAEAKAGAAGTFRGSCLTAKGADKVWEVAIAPVEGPDGRAERILCISRDITALYRAEREARAGAGMLDGVLQGLDQGLLAFDRDGRLRCRNRRAADLLQISTSFLGDRPTAEDLRRHLAQIGHYARAESTVQDLVRKPGFRHLPPCYEYATPNGVVLEVRTRTLPDGGVIQTFADITARREAEKDRRAAAERYRALAEATSALVWRASPDGQVVDDHSWSAFTGVAATGGQGWLSAVHSDDREAVFLDWQHALASATPHLLECRIRQADGAYRWMSGKVVPVHRRDGSIREWIGALTDVHEARTAQDALARSEDRLREAVQATALGIWDHDLVSGQRQWSKEMRDLVGTGEAAPDLDRLLAMVHPDDRHEAATLFGAEPKWEDGSREVELRLVDGDGSIRWVACGAKLHRDPSGSAQRIVGTMRDVTRRRERDAALVRLAHFDPLTGLPNRVHLCEQMDACLGGSRAATLVLLDLQGFRAVNETMGHVAGDKLLRDVADRLRRITPEAALLARVGGDEFALLLPGLGDPLRAARVAEQVKASLVPAFEVDGQAASLGAQVGIAVSPAHGHTSEELMASATLALHAAAASTSGVGLFTPVLRQQAQARRNLESELRRAHRDGEFELHFQPQVRMRGRSAFGAEALLRWRHPEKGLLSPAAFLPVLCTSPLAAPVGDWVVGEACAQAARFRDAGRPLRVAVNLFSAQLHGDGLVSTVARALQESGLDPAALQIEVTEDSIVKDDGTILERLRSLRDLGVGIAFDDYGTGYASLSMLKRYPITELKIDQSFVRNLLADEGDDMIVESVVRLAAAFGMEVVAEGVETELHESRLIGLGCKSGQGYLYGRPQPADHLVRALLASADNPATSAA